MRIIFVSLLEDRMERNKGFLEKYTTKIIIGGFLIIVFLWGGSFFLFTYFFPNISESGTFGDTFGAINSLFSGLAFLGIIYTILLQGEELKLQRQELKETRIELEKSAVAQQEQVEVQELIARLNAYSGLLNYYSGKKVSPHIELSPGKVKEKMKEIINFLEDKSGKK